MITGLLRPTSGKICIDNRVINSAGEQELALLRNQKIGYILQEQNLLSNYTVLENVWMPGIIYKGKSKESVKAMAERILELVGLKEQRDSYPNQISDGEARRVDIARALINTPEVIIADEPTSNLDPDNSAQIIQLFRGISDSGVAVIISTHDLSALKYSDKVFLMRQGKLEKKEEDIINKGEKYEWNKEINYRIGWGDTSS